MWSQRESNPCPDVRVLCYSLAPFTINLTLQVSYTPVHPHFTSFHCFQQTTCQKPDSKLHLCISFSRTDDVSDLLKRLDIDGSLTARKELACEMGCPTDLMGESAKMNI